MSNQDPTMDLGQASPEDLMRVIREFKAKGHKHLKMDRQSLEAMPQISRKFLEFVRDTLSEMGLIDTAGIASPRYGVALEVDQTESPETVMRDMWNARAADWAVVESPHNYAVTFQTLMEHLKIKGKGKKEVLLSLGSGPGIYETFLGTLMHGAGDMRIICLDSAKEMTRIQREMLGKIRICKIGSPTLSYLSNVAAMTGDMMNLEFKPGTIDQIFCNNSLQWASDWRKAIAEMARVINPKGLGYLYLFVHRHPMEVFTAEGKPIFKFGDFAIPELFDTLEAHRFKVYHMRQIAGAPGTGQMGNAANRVFVLAKFIAEGDLSSWRDAKISSAASVMSLSHGIKRLT